jgi:hypothetical protein
MKTTLSLAALLILTGCASIAGSKMQPVSLQTMHDAHEVTGAACTLVSDAGQWFVTTPGSVTIQKSTGDLAVNCVKDVDLVGQATVVSKSNTAVWGNILLGGGIGYIIDRNTGAGFDYPTLITVPLARTAVPGPVATAK